MSIFLRFIKPNSPDIRLKTYETDAPHLITAMLGAGYELTTLKVE